MNVGDIILLVLTALAPATVAYIVMQAIKANTAFDKLPGLVKQVGVLLLAALFNWLTLKTGIKWPESLAGFTDSATVMAFVTGLEAWLVHKFFKAPATA